MPTRATMETALITRPIGLIHAKVSLEFNLRHFDLFEIDLQHIIHGINETRRSLFTVESVTEIALALLDGENLKVDDQKQFGSDSCNYFIKTGTHKGKNYKIVLCICSDKPTTIGIITLFRIRGDHESI